MSDQKGLTTLDPDVTRAMLMYAKMQPMKDALGCAGLTDSELQLYAMVCNHTGLDPFLKQIYAIKRGGKVTHQTGIDGYRSTAENTGQYRGSDEAVFEECDCGDPDSPPRHPFLARVVVRRATPEGNIVEQVGLARFHELKPAHTRKDDKSAYEDAMWWRMPYNQLSKCAEANGLRKAFPRILGGVYITDEMQHGDIYEGTSTEVPAKSSAAERLAARRAAAEPKAPEVTEAEPETETDQEAVEAEAAWVASQDEPTEEVAQVPVWGAPTVAGPRPDCPNGHGPMSDSQYGGPGSYWCRTCKAKVHQNA